MNLKRESIPEWVSDLIERHREIDSLLMPAYIDLDLPQRVVPFPQVVFLGSGGGFIHFSIDDPTGQLRLGEGAEAFLPPELEGEPSVGPTFLDLTANYLGDGASAKIESIVFYANEESSLEAGIFRAVKLGFEGGEGFALDPLSFSGIRIGVIPDLSSVVGSLRGVHAVGMRPG